MGRPLFVLISIWGAMFLSSCASAEPSNDCAGAGGQCSVAQHDANEPMRRGDFEAMLKAYFDEHPEIIAEVSQKLRAKQLAERQAQGKKALAENRSELFGEASDPVIGNPLGDVTLVEFFDNECPYCKKLSPAIEKLVSEDSGVRVVLKEFPILGPGSEISARYALAAIDQGKYAQFHSALMEDKTPEHQLAEPHILEIAAKAGLDVERLKKDAAQPAITARIEANRTLARKLTISGTPGLVIGDKIESGALTIESLRQAVIESRKARQPVG
jgi:protein-disulfide isomerase